MNTRHHVNQDCRVHWHRCQSDLKVFNKIPFKSSQNLNMEIFQYIGRIFCLDFKKMPLKCHTKYLAYTLNGNSIWWKIRILMKFLSNSSWVCQQEFPQNDISVYGNAIYLVRTPFVVHTLMPQQNHHFVDDIFACIFFLKYNSILYKFNHILWPSVHLTIGEGYKTSYMRLFVGWNNGNTFTELVCLSHMDDNDKSLWHVYTSVKWVIISSVNVLLSVHSHAITWTNTDLLISRKLTNRCEISTRNKGFLASKCIWKCPLKGWPFLLVYITLYNGCNYLLLGWK